MFRKKKQLDYRLIGGANPPNMRLENMTPDQMTLMINVELISGDFESLMALDVYVTDEYGMRSDSQLTAHNAERTVAVWGFAVDQLSREFDIHFSDGGTARIAIR